MSMSSRITRLGPDTNQWIVVEHLSEARRLLIILRRKALSDKARNTLDTLDHVLALAIRAVGRLGGEK